MSDSSPTDSKHDSTRADPAKPRTVVLTGVSRGLGRAMLEHFAERGHTVWGCARDPHVVAELREQFSDPHRLEVVDVSLAEQVEGWAASCTGPVDLLVNNA